MRKKFYRVFSIFLAIFLLISPLAEADESQMRPWDEEIIYMIMTDRFFDGNPSNNNPENIEGSFDKGHPEAYHGEIGRESCRERV